MAIAGLYPFTNRWHSEGTLHIISDTHFDDADLACGIKCRPSSEEIVKQINAKCGRKDTLIHLGDVGNVEYIKQLRGYKILIMGNHDAGRTNYERQKWVKRFDQKDYTRNEAIAEMKKLYPGCRYTALDGYQFHSPFTYWDVEADNMLFDEVYEGPLMIGEKLILSHEPVDVSWAYNIHGHDHAGHKRKNHTNVCGDVHGWTPLNMNQFMKSGALARVETIHRDTIDKATVRKAKRGGKKIGER